MTDSDSSQTDDIAMYVEGLGTQTTAITNNTLHQYANFSGIDSRIRTGSPTLNLTVIGNTIANPGTFASNGLFVSVGAATNDGDTICAGISGNTMAGLGANGSTNFRLRQRFDTTVKLPGYAGAADDTAAVVSFVQGNNPGAETGSATANFPDGGGGFVGGGACPTP